MSGNEWQDVFCGREKELQFLKDKWDLIASSEKPEPQCIALIAESGFGKTRLVQEFYSWLVEKEDREGYWPKKLGSEVENLRVNPDFNKADKRPTMPFLWWGVRFNGSQDRNQHVGSSLPTYIPHLVPHFYELHAARERASVILNGGGLLINLATLGSIQLVQSISELGNLGFSAAVLARDKYLSKKDKTNKGSVKNIQNGHLRDQVDILYRDFRSMMTPSMDGGIAFQDVLKVIKGKTNLESVMATMKPVPTVIFLDDAQWIDEDALSLISKLMEDAKSNSWPLMIIATHWESEWKKKEVELDSGSKFVSFARSCSANRKFLNKIYGLETMLKSAFPNLTCKQRKIIVDRTDGNPGYMEAIIRDLNDEPEYFVEEDFNKPLTNEGEEYIQRQECDFFNITEKRFKKLPLELRKALRWATYQGVAFSEELSRSMYYEMIESSNDIVDFDMAESPFCFISREKAPISEFRQQLFFEVANKRLKSKSEELERLKKATKNAILSWMNSNDIAKANDSELKLIIGLAKLHFDRSNKVDNKNLLRLLNESKEYYLETSQSRTANVIQDDIDYKFEEDMEYQKNEYLNYINGYNEVFTPAEQLAMEVDDDEAEMFDAMVDPEGEAKAYDLEQRNNGLLTSEFELKLELELDEARARAEYETFIEKEEYYIREVYSYIFIPSHAIEIIKEYEHKHDVLVSEFERREEIWEKVGDYGVLYERFCDTNRYDDIFHYVGIPFLFIDEHEVDRGKPSLIDWQVYRPANKHLGMIAIDKKSKEGELIEFEACDQDFLSEGNTHDILNLIDHGIDFGLWNKSIDWKEVKEKFTDMLKKKDREVGSPEFIGEIKDKSVSEDDCPF